MEKTKGTTHISIRDICYISLFSALTAVMAQISIPLPGGVPLTLQTLAMMLSGIVLGSKRGAISALVYVLLAMTGAPVLAGLSGGVSTVFGVTGGFILSFPLLAFLSGILSEKGTRSPLYWIGIAAGVIANYAIGTLWFCVTSGTDIMYALSICVLPFIPTDLLKLVLSGLIGDTVRKILKKKAL